MRIGDWSSDVCSSDLVVGFLARKLGADQQRMRDCAGVEAERQVGLVEQVLARGEVVVGRDRDLGAIGGDRARIDVLVELVLIGPACAVAQRDAFAERSEEHTSELQSLMRTSYAVFCLKKKQTIS